MSFRNGQTVIVSHFDNADSAEPVLIGTEEAELIGIVSIYEADAGLVWVRPFNTEDRIKVHIRDIAHPKEEL